MLLVFSASCTRLRVSSQIEPTVEAPPHPKQIQREKRMFLNLPADFSISPFSSLTPEERALDWGKEYLIALSFAEDFDLYRAITGFKRALCLLPPGNHPRRMELEYAVALAYFLGKKYVEVVYAVESTDLVKADSSFPAFDDLLLIMYDSYTHLGKQVHAAHILSLIEEYNADRAHQLNLLSAVKRADFDALEHEMSTCEQHAYIEKMLSGYYKEAKSVKKAQALNAILPGAGYWYVGLKETAVTAFLVNTLFIAAGAHFLANGNPAAGAIILSLEGGWYFGGIAGAGYAAKYYNEQLYCSYANKITQREEYFPLMMLRFTF